MQFPPENRNVANRYLALQQQADAVAATITIKGGGFVSIRDANPFRYAGSSSVWSFREKDPGDAYATYICALTFQGESYATGRIGIVNGEWFNSAFDLAYCMTSPTTVSLFDLGGVYGDGAGDCEFRIKQNANGSLTLTQTSDRGIFTYHKRGHTLTLEKGI